MGMLNTYGVAPAAASAAGTGASVTASAQTTGTASTVLFALGIALIVLTAIFAIAAIRGLLPRRNDIHGPLPQRKEKS
jgi:hypothetical protein